LFSCEEILPELIGKIRSTLKQKSDGTFLWVSFALKDIQEKEPSEPEACLDELLRGLYLIYERILRDVEPDRRNVIQLVLKWVLFAERPLLLEELADAMDFEISDEMSKVDRAKDSIIFCGHFLKLSTPMLTQTHQSHRRVSEGIVQIVHGSGRDYLLSLPTPRDNTGWPPRFNPEEGHSVVASRCVSYLGSQCLRGGRASPACQLSRSGSVNPSIAGVPLCEYALSHWVIHFRKSGVLGTNVLRNSPGSFFSTPILRETLRYAMAIM